MLSVNRVFFVFSAVVFLRHPLYAFSILLVVRGF